MINLSFKYRCFPNDLKLVEVSHFKKKTTKKPKKPIKTDDLDKENFRPVNILFNVPKFFQRIIYSQIDAFM